MNWLKLQIRSHNRIEHQTITNYRTKKTTIQVLPNRIQETTTRHVLEFWYGMEMEEEDERRNLCGCRQGNGHDTWRMNGFKMSEECRHLRAPNDSQDKTRRRRTSLTKTHSILRRVTFLSNSISIVYVYNSQAPLYIV